MSTSRLAPVLLFALAGCTQGTWWYQDDAGVPDQYDLLDHFSDTPTFTDAQVLAKLDSCKIRVLYGSYGTLPVDAPAKIDAWNSFLHGKLRESHILLGDFADLADPEPLLDKIDARVIGYHAVASATGRFDAVHLDIEPQQDPVCKAGDPLQDPVACHALVVALLDTVTAVRTHLAGQGVGLYVDLFHDWDDASPGARVAWPPAPTPADSRNAWFAAMSSQVDGVTIMAYGSSNYLTTASKVAWEWANMTKPVRVGTRTEDYGGDLLAMRQAGTNLYALPQKYLTDFHDFNEIFAGGGCP